MTAYRMLATSSAYSEVREGDIVYSAAHYDYGCAHRVSVAFGREHISVSLQPDGDYPYLAVPVADLEEIKDAEHSKTS